MTSRQAWTDQENAALVALYFVMLDLAIAGKPYIKAVMIRHQQCSDERFSIESGLNNAPLKARSRGSIEAKLMNTSAAHRDLDPTAITMDSYGYRCLSNYQKSLFTVLESQKVAMDRELDERTLDKIRDLKEIGLA